MKQVLRLKLAWMACMCLLATTAIAQERVVSGRVSSTEDGTAIPGVNVVVKGTTNGTTTDAEGNYKLSVPSGGGTLVFSFIGLKTEEVSVGERTTVDIGLGLDVTQLSEVVVVGYGTQSKRDLTGSIASISGKDIASMPIQSFDQAMQGRSPGVNISTPNGVLNNPPVIRIRGVSSISLSSYPLIVIDGVPTFTGDNSGTNAPNNPLSNINPADIESIEVLKDASASAIYGSRASAGVILITTKRGQKGKTRVNLDSWVGLTQPFRLFEVLDAQTYMDMKNEGVRNLNANRQAVTGVSPNYIEGFRPLYDANGELVDTKWYDHVYQNGFSHSNTISFSGGTDATTYFLSVGRTAQEGMIKSNEFSRTSVRINLDQKLYDWLSIGTNVGFSNNYNSAPSTGSLPGSAFATAGLGRLPIVLPPNVAPYNPDGSYATNGAGIGAGNNVDPITGNPLAPGYYNPVLILDKNSFTSESNQLAGSIFANFTLYKGLNFRTSFGVDRISFEDISFSTGLGGDGFSAGGSANNLYRTNNRWNWQNTLQYDFKVADAHTFSVLAGAEEQHTEVARWGATRTTVADVFFETFQGNFTNIAVSGNLQTENYLISYFGRLNYDFNKKYFAAFNVRRDGYSAWAEKWGTFYGGSLGYTISEEEFWKNSSALNNISFLKVKASYGEVGNSNGISDFASLQLYSSGLYGAAATLGYNQAGNPGLTWETSKKTDIGMMFGILQDRISGEFSYYKNLVDGLILDVPQASSKGIPGNTLPVNVGSMVNSGIEVAVKFNAISSGDFSWVISANATTLKNEVLTLNSPTARIQTATGGLESPSITQVGESVGSILAVPNLGVNEANGRRMVQLADGTIAEYNHQGTGWTVVGTGAAIAAPSQLVDGRIYGPTLPKYYGGLDNTFRYKNWDLAVFLQFSGGNYVYNGTKAGLRDQRFWNNHTDILNRWTPENPGGTIPRVVYGDNVSNGSAMVISENVEKGDFLRGRNLSLGYSLNKALLNKIKMTNARVYVQCQNAFLITKYTGIDPENQSNGNSTTSASVDRNSVGQARSFTAGINIGF
jgi:TonB-dependent starch-binding outer membrane protein SusC